MSAQAWWISWYNTAPLSSFELHSPWWVSGYRCSDDAETIVAAVRAVDETAAWAQVQDAYDDEPDSLERRFTEPLTASPFTGRFPQAGWMAWDDDRTCGCDTCAASDPGGKP